MPQRRRRRIPSSNDAMNNPEWPLMTKRPRTTSRAPSVIPHESLALRHEISRTPNHTQRIPWSDCELHASMHDVVAESNRDRLAGLWINRRRKKRHGREKFFHLTIPSDKV